MFERRLKVFLMLLFAMTGVLALRAAQVQVVQREDWRAKAAETMTGWRPIEAQRGNIVDVKGRVVALDRPCIDACVNFRALTDPPNPAWVRGLAAKRLIDSLGDAFTKSPRARRTALLDVEVGRVKADINTMWARLAAASGTPVERVSEARDGIVRKVLMRRRAVWYRNYRVALKRFAERGPAPAWRRWLVDEAAEAPRREQFTTLTVSEEEEYHPILRAVDNPVQNELRKHIEAYPGLVLRHGAERYYPYGDAGCHLLGSLAPVNRDDLTNDPNVGKDERRQYYPNDPIGRGGIEGLAEARLRGSRGRVVTVEGRETPDARVEAAPGGAVRLTIDIELQQDVTHLFRHARVLNEFTTPKTFDTVEMHGGAVVIDVASGAVRALVSYPTFDLNELKARYAELLADELNLPLLNRATQVAREPGSTVKPLVGLAAVAEGHIGVRDGIACGGFVVVNGRPLRRGKCWTQTMFGIGRHQIPPNDPHVGSFGNADGELMFSDAVQRSCNVYFETLGDRLGVEGLSKWYRRFGLGEPTGLGIPEVRGSLPEDYRGPASERRFATMIAAIGQGSTLATPVQMANVAATVARNGVWVRPTLLEPGQGMPAPGARLGPDRVDLGLPREAVRAAQEGMTRVVNSEAGSAYRTVRRDDLLIAGKTGTAEASRVAVKVFDEKGKPVLDEDGRPKMAFLAPSSPLKPNPKAPWYRGWGKAGTALNHSWFIGFAPADDPKIAFAVMLEYGGSGGSGAGLVAKKIIDACVERRYLERDADRKPAADRPAALEPRQGPAAQTPPPAGR